MTDINVEDIERNSSAIIPQTQEVQHQQQQQQQQQTSSRTNHNSGRGGQSTKTILKPYSS